METIKTFLDFAGYISTIIVIVGAIAGVVVWFMGISPALYRLGNGLVKNDNVVRCKN